MGRDALEGYVYVILHPNYPGILKIGKSVKPLFRVKQANTWCPSGAYKVFACFYFDDYHKAEWIIHEHFENNRIKNTEWFEVPLGDVLQKLATTAGENYDNSTH